MDWIILTPKPQKGNDSMDMAGLSNTDWDIIPGLQTSDEQF